MLYVTFLSILPAFVKERIIQQSGHTRHIYNIGESLSTSPAYDIRQLVILYLYLYYRNTWNLFI